MSTWRGATPPPLPRIGPAGWARVVLRGSALVLVTYGGLLLLLLLRLVEAPLCGLRRPVTPFVTQGVCTAALAILGLRHRVKGRPMAGPGAVVANHSSWLDIFALNAVDRVYFVAKAEVTGWPGIGWLAQATGTQFIRRDPREAAAQAATLDARLRAGHRLLFFPEGTSTDGLRVLPFKTTLFAAFHGDGLADRLRVQPVSVIYTAPPGRDAAFYGFWGDMPMGPHLLAVLAEAPQGRVEVVFHEPVAVAAAGDRKVLARTTEAAVRAGFEAARAGS